jgi:hypothetical protein
MSSITNPVKSGVWRPVRTMSRPVKTVPTSLAITSTGRPDIMPPCDAGLSQMVVENLIPHVPAFAGMAEGKTGSAIQMR